MNENAFNQLLQSIANGTPFNYTQGTFNMPEVKRPEGQFIVGSVRADNSLSFSERPVVHTTVGAARAEVTRLAKANPGKQYAYLRVMGVAKSQDVVWAEV